MDRYCKHSLLVEDSIESHMFPVPNFVIIVIIVIV